MASPRAEIDRTAGAIMVLLCATWGLQQVAIKLAAPDVSPLAQVAIRSGAGALLVGAWARARGLPLGLGAPTWRPGLVAGALFAVEFLLIAEGLRRTSASHMAVFLYTAPVFTALGLHVRVRSERLSPRRWAGVAIAFAGIGVAFAGGGGRSGQATLAGDALGVLAGLAWGATTVVIRASSLSDAPAARTLLYQLGVGFAVLLPAAVLSGQLAAARPTPIALASLAFQGAIVSFASYLAWFWLLTRYLASRLAILSFMTPLLGVTFGVVLLGEPLDAAFLGGAVLVLAGVVLVIGPGGGRSRSTG
jgi:drug/metabolite transporter (DMT)-like permease